MSQRSRHVRNISHRRSSYENNSVGDDGSSKKSSKEINEVLCTKSPTTKSDKWRKGGKDNEVYRICQAILLLLCVLSLSYQSIYHDRIVYGLLENGATTCDYETHPKRDGTLVAMTLGYSVARSIAYGVTGFMLVYSLISGKPHWSFPFLALFLADLVSNVSNGILTIFLFFQKLRFITASYYAISVILLIAGEIWAFMGVLWLYEHNVYE